MTFNGQQAEQKVCELCGRPWNFWLMSGEVSTRPWDYDLLVGLWVGNFKALP